MLLSFKGLLKLTQKQGEERHLRQLLIILHEEPKALLRIIKWKRAKLGGNGILLFSLFGKYSFGLIVPTSEKEGSHRRCNDILKYAHVYLMVAHIHVETRLPKLLSQP